MVRKLLVGALGVGALVYALSCPTGDTLRPCTEEDEVPPSGVVCMWDASHQGNGTGRSFVRYSDGTQRFTDGGRH